MLLSHQLVVPQWLRVLTGWKRWAPKKRGQPLELDRSIQQHQCRHSAASIERGPVFQKMYAPKSDTSLVAPVQHFSLLQEGLLTNLNLTDVAEIVQIDTHFAVFGVVEPVPRS